MRRYQQRIFHEYKPPIKSPEHELPKLCLIFGILRYSHKKSQLFKYLERLVVTRNGYNDDITAFVSHVDFVTFYQISNKRVILLKTFLNLNSTTTHWFACFAINLSIWKSIDFMKGRCSLRIRIMYPTFINFWKRTNQGRI